MAGLMALTIAGNIGADPQFAQENGSTRLSFRVAVNTWDKKAGEKTTWFGVTAWGAYAEALHKGGRLRKGTTVVVSGQLEAREYTNKNGQIITALDVKPDSIQSFAPRVDDGESGGDEPPF